MGNIFSLCSIIIAAFSIYNGYRHNKNKEGQLFLLLFFFGTFSYATGEIIWLTYENILKIQVPFPSYADILYLLQIGFYFSAFIYTLKSKERLYGMFKFLIDVFVIMTVISVFSFYYLISPMLTSSNASLLERFVSVGYPLGDLLLIFGSMSLIFISESCNIKKWTGLLITGLFIQIWADTIYSYTQFTNTYISGTMIDPLYSLSSLLIGYAGFSYYVQTEENKKNRARQLYNKVPLFSFIIPYSVIFIFLIFVYYYQKNDMIFRIGFLICTLLIIARQFLTLLENNNLIDKNFKKTKELMKNEQRYRSLFEYNANAIVTVDLTGHITSLKQISIISIWEAKRRITW
ncbi:hypothetical protein [Bacillus andreraoultii]|uniref:hypothetical protein n=1 Tax=Bacillus andreraoultii TaxID=1499685 RepID=UPI001111E7DC|nr:hypothetical protein [Bacillus andreraoultii]